VVECWICNREVAGLSHFAPRSTQPSIPRGAVNEYQLRLGRQRPVWLIPVADETQDVQVKLRYPLLMRAEIYLCALEMLRLQALYKSSTL